MAGTERRTADGNSLYRGAHLISGWTRDQSNDYVAPLYAVYFVCSSGTLIRISTSSRERRQRLIWKRCCYCSSNWCRNFGCSILNAQDERGMKGSSDIAIQLSTLWWRTARKLQILGGADFIPSTDCKYLMGKHSQPTWQRRRKVERFSEWIARSSNKVAAVIGEGKMQMTQLESDGFWINDKLLIWTATHRNE